MLDVTVPELAESIAEAAIDSWLVAIGDPVKSGQNICTIETDKVVLEVPAQGDGVVVEILKKEGEDVASKEVIAKIDTSATAAAAPAKEEASQPAAAPAQTPAPAVAPVSGAPSSPAARKAAAESHVDLANVAGSGRDGRITKADVASSDTSVAAAPMAPSPAAPAPGSRNDRRKKMSSMRMKIASRLLQSQRESAILTTFNEVDMTEVILLRKMYRDEFEKTYGVKLGFMSFFIKATVAALSKHPLVNASIDGNEIVEHDYCDIGIAVGGPRGLVVPVLRNAENMTMAQIESNVSDFGRRAQDGSIGIEELTGGTFTITNGGVFGSMLSTPIINPPQSGILGVHATKERAVVVDGEVVVRPMNYLALSYDHRIIDGRDAVLFLVSVKQALEQPARLLLDI